MPNEKWGKKTCYDIVNAWLDHLFNNGGDEGKSIVEDFIKADAINAIYIEFVEGLESDGTTNPLNGTIMMPLDMGVATDDGGIGYEASAFGHELYHLLRQPSDEMGLAKTEKEAYDFQATLQKNMEIPLSPAVEAISSLGNSQEDLQKVAEALDVPLAYSLTEQDPVTNWVAKRVVNVLELVSGCYLGGTSSIWCPAPSNNYDIRYVPPSH